MSTSRFSPDQISAGKRILEVLRNPGNLYATLGGCAGTGKTFLVAPIVQRVREANPGRDVVYAASTGKAAANLSRRIGQPVSTVHALIFGEVFDDPEGKLSFSGLRAPCKPGGLVIVDESSMIGRWLFAQMLKAIRMAPGAQYLFLGDPKQLPPVKDQFGPDLQKPDALLTTVHRQEDDSPVLELATAIREGRMESWSEGYEGDDDRLELYDSLEDAVEWLHGHLSKGDDAVMLSYTNQTRNQMNHRIRELFGRTSPISLGERLLCRSNAGKLGVMNGEVFTVHDLRPFGELQGRQIWRLHSPDLKGHALVAPWFLGQDRKAFLGWRKSLEPLLGDEIHDLIHVDYGYALTTHTSQGSQWAHVGLILDGGFWGLQARSRDESDRLLYTAVTRTTDKLAMFYLDLVPEEEAEESP